jgi:NAD(P)-dependent dehydrogenase (short-subunit alcohol dehydrogenase family)
VLVTGASRGIGAAIARGLAEAGDRVAVHYVRSRSAAEDVASSLPGGPHVVVGADLADSAAVHAMVDEAAAELGGLEVLVNNAGIYVAHDLASSSYEEWRAVWEQTLLVDLVGAANVTWCAVRHMLQAGSGRIVNVSSRGAYRGEPRAPAYAAAKAGLIAFANSLARALAVHRISVTSVVPGWTETDMAADSLSGPRAESIRAESPFGRVATPVDVARAVVYLASPEAEFASGTTLHVNGASYVTL